VKLQDAIRLARQAKKHANVNHARRFAQHVVPEVVRPARVIWNQAIGALFILLAVPAILKTVQLFRSFQTDPKSGFGLGLSLIFVVVMLFFGIGSFMKARRIAGTPRRS